MSSSSKFVVAIHILSAMSINRDELTKSEQLAWSINTNPVVVRRILGLLRKAGLVISVSGKEGGSRLARPPEEISLRDIYEAVDEGDLFHLHYASPNCDCPVGAYVQDSICDIFSDASQAVKNVLAEKSLADVTQSILERSGLAEKLRSGYTIPQLKETYRFRDGKLVKKTAV